MKMGGLGFAPSANIGVNGAYFEPVHGSAPRVSPGKANPSAMFLTCAMLLDYLNFQNDASRIRQAVHQVVKAGKHVTYDLGGNATTAEMASEIIAACLAPRYQKSIAFLATGSELLNGDLLESNAHITSSIVTEAGGLVRAKAIVGDKRNDIWAQLTYLLEHNDAVIVMGGLGPTSDDITRYAISDATQLPLEMDKISLQHIQSRLQTFGLQMTEENERQALFPSTAQVITNKFGTANACYIRWNQRDIFMLPGPPQEYMPLFENDVMPILEREHYFSSIKMKRYLTLGLIEGEISRDLDKLAERYGIDSAYRWNYPYLEIKMNYGENHPYKQELFEKVEVLIGQHIVSTDARQDAKSQLKTLLSNLTNQTVISVDSNVSSLLAEFICPKLYFNEDKQSPSVSSYHFHFDVTWPGNNHVQQTLFFQCGGYSQDKLIHKHDMQAPKREHGTELYIQCYFAWQLSLFIQKTTEDLYYE